MATKEVTKENAERILSYGNYRAFNLMTMAEEGGYWSHVDWEYVKEKLGNIKWEDFDKKKAKTKKEKK